MAECSAICCDEDCIAFKHSAGPSNCDPCQDLGGEISDCDITTSLDNLFHSIGPKLSRRGHEDYRCFYIQNVSEVSTLRNVTIYFDGEGRQVPGKRGGAYVAFGVKLQNEIQTVVVNGAAPPNPGEYFELEIPGYSPSFKVYYDANITKWIGNFQTSMRAVDGLGDVIVTGEGTIGTTLADPSVNVTFTINYIKQAGRHQIDLATVVTNTLLNNTVTPMPEQEGSPVNTTAEVIPDEITAPSGIVFNYYLKGNPMNVGNLAPGEYLPIWIRRTLPIVEEYYGPLARSGQMAKLLDGFNIAVVATSP